MASIVVTSRGLSSPHGSIASIASSSSSSSSSSSNSNSINSISIPHPSHASKRPAPHDGMSTTTTSTADPAPPRKRRHPSPPPSATAATATATATATASHDAPPDTPLTPATADTADELDRLFEKPYPSAPSRSLTLRYSPPPRPTPNSPESLAAAEDPASAFYHYTPRSVDYTYHSFQTTLERSCRYYPTFLTFMWKVHVDGALCGIRAALGLGRHTRIRLYVQGRVISPGRLFNEVERIIMFDDQDGLFGSDEEVVVVAEFPFL
ncbi:hypothetical protein DFH27DRAFT_185579 [Peziza echinospora]|nr:hypothetical protein DFH27DRAFT_185579 [Peziza echinospora]